MTEEEVPSVNPKLDAMCEMLKTIHDLNERNKMLEAQIEGMKSELHHRLVSPSHDDSDCLDKIVGLDRLWQFGKEF